MLSIEQTARWDFLQATAAVQQVRMGARSETGEEERRVRVSESERGKGHAERTGGREEDGASK